MIRIKGLKQERISGFHLLKVKSTRGRFLDLKFSKFRYYFTTFFSDILITYALKRRR